MELNSSDSKCTRHLDSLQVPMSGDYITVVSPHFKSVLAAGDHLVDAVEDISTTAYAAVPGGVQRILYTSVALVIIQAVQIGWSMGQLNFSTFHNPDDCAKHPISPKTCTMFPGHTTSDWTWLVNIWLVGAMMSSLLSGRLADRIGRKRLTLVNAVTMTIGAAVQIAATNLAMFAVGRFISGLATGIASTVPQSYINEVSPPHLRYTLGILYQLAYATGIVLVTTSFFVVGDAADGWRYIAAFPIILGGLIGGLAPSMMVESPPWLIAQGRHDDAIQELTRIVGASNVSQALSLIDCADTASIGQGQENGDHSPQMIDGHGVPTNMTTPWKALLSPWYRQQTFMAIGLSVAQQLSGINAVFLYSSSIFREAGLQDDRIGSLVVNVFNMLPTLFAGLMVNRLGNRRMMLLGHVVMMLCASGMTIALSTKTATLAIGFTAAYVSIYAVSLGPLTLVIAASIFPDALRANGTAVCLAVNWLGTVIVGITYPYVAEHLGSLGFLPFVGTLAILTLYMKRMLPETSGKTNDEIQAIFANRLRARS